MEAALIEKFFNKQCTSSEAKQVLLYLQAHPPVLEKYVSKDEWNAVANNNSLPDEQWQELWQRIQQKNKAKVILIRLKRLAVAASFVCVIIATYYFLNPVKQTLQPLAKTTAPAFKKETVSNTTNKIMHVTLQDSSYVLLSPASAISYTKPFHHNKREILLEGEAEFHVSKNKAKPFTVYAGALATTALGTVFSVKKNKQNNITVKLFKGKVVIQSTDKNLSGWNKDVYLLPGEQMKFNMYDALVTVQKTSNNSSERLVVKNKTKQLVATDSLKDELVFNNTLLSQVLNKLSLFYNVKIKYDSLLIDTMNFTGTVSKSDSLPVILKAIGNMNDLEVLQNEDEFIISKQQ